MASGGSARWGSRPCSTATPARTRSCRNLADAVLATTGPQYFSDHDGEHFMALAAKTSHKRMVFGGDCYNYGLLASGHIDMVVEAGLKLHDFAALAPIVEGAGGTMCDWNGDPLSAGQFGARHRTRRSGTARGCDRRARLPPSARLGAHPMPIRPSWHPGYARAASLVFLIEVVIALWVRDDVIRPYVGDVLAVILVYLVLRAISTLRVVPAALIAALTVGILVEIGQAADLLGILGLSHNRLAAVASGNLLRHRRSFLRYAAGAAIAVMAECWRKPAATAR